MPLNKTALFTFYFLVLSHLGFSQSNTIKTEKAYYLAFDSIIGIENSGLYNGKRYIDRYRSSEENHRYFKDYNFINGYVLYNDQPYYDVSLKYDLFEDVLIAKLKGDKKFFNMVFITQQVKAFNIHDTPFVNINNYKNSEDLNGFAELLYESGKIVVLKRHQKEKKDKIKGQTVIHEFKLNYSYLVSNHKNTTILKSKKDMKDIFPDKMESINAFYKNNKSLNENNPDLFMVKLADFINNLN